jgi:hypothetical protein
MSSQCQIFCKSSSITTKDLKGLGFDDTKTVLGVAMAQWNDSNGEEWQGVGDTTMVVHYKDMKRKNYFIGVSNITLMYVFSFKFFMICFSKKVCDDKKRHIVRELPVTAKTEFYLLEDTFISLHNPDEKITIGLIFLNEVIVKLKVK